MYIVLAYYSLTAHCAQHRCLDTAILFNSSNKCILQFIIYTECRPGREGGILGNISYGVSLNLQDAVKQALLRLLVPGFCKSCRPSCSKSSFSPLCPFQLCSACPNLGFCSCMIITMRFSSIHAAFTEYHLCKRCAGIVQITDSGKGNCFCYQSICIVSLRAMGPSVLC